jgi:type I restriction enzyme S subunit
MNRFPIEKLAALCREITVGHVGKMADQYVSLGVPFLRSQDIAAGFIRTDALKFIPATFHAQLKKSQLAPGDVVIVRTGYPGTAAVVPTSLPDANCADLVIARPGPRLNARFLTFVLNSPWGKAQVRGRLVGVAQQHFNVRVAQALDVPAPPLTVQDRIAFILGAYDDLIEVNQRRIAVLEEMARRLFEEWFVRFRFPGYEELSIIETANGALPQGWRRCRIGELTSFLSRGISPKYDETAATFVVGQKCIRDQRLNLELARRQFRTPPTEKLVQGGDVLINSTGVGTLGRVAQAEEIPEGLTVDTHVTIVRPRTDLDRDFFGLAMLRLEPVFDRLGTGATGQTELNRNRIADTFTLQPPSALQVAFGRHARPLRALAVQLARHNQVLASCRDLLLPRLVSGEMSVTEAKRELEDAA